MTHNAWHGKLITLRDVEPNDWEAFYGFDQDSDAQRHGWEVHFPRSREGSKQWAEEKAKKKSEDDNHFFAITDPNLVIVGSISAHGCDRRNGAFQYGISLGREFWQKGYGTDAMRVMFRYYFDELGYHRVWARVYAFNDRSIALHESFGFVREGALREAHYTGGRRHDVALFGMMAPEFRTKQMTKTE